MWFLSYLTIANIRNFVGQVVVLIQLLFKLLLWVAVAVVVVRLFAAVVVRGQYPVISINWDTLLSFLREMKWPLVVVVAIIVLRKRWGGLIDRLREFVFPGGKVTLDPPRQPDPAEIRTVAQPQAASELREQTEYERIFQGIYGTQLAALESLKAYADGQRSDDMLMYVQQHQRMAAPTGKAYTNVRDFMKWLLDLELVRFTPDKDIYAITGKGRRFLEYITSRNYDLNAKPY